MKDKRPIRWLTFDVLGTCVDWRTTLSEEGSKLWNRLGLQPAIDWNSFAVAWFENYAFGIQAANAPGPWITAEQIIRGGLVEALASIGVPPLSGHDLDALCELWDLLHPWPDARHGLERIRQTGRSVATLSNFGIQTLRAIGAHGHLPWDRILSSETVKRYKPDPAVYEMAVELLHEEAAKIMMVAAHTYDLQAAAQLGFATAFVIRAGENPPPPPHTFDMVVTDFNELALRIAQDYSI